MSEWLVVLSGLVDWCFSTHTRGAAGMSNGVTERGRLSSGSGETGWGRERPLYVLMVLPLYPGPIVLKLIVESKDVDELTKCSM
jgi:hypothetical protein